jgi:hypothetical protein
VPKQQRHASPCLPTAFSARLRASASAERTGAQKKPDQTSREMILILYSPGYYPPSAQSRGPREGDNQGRNINTVSNNVTIVLYLSITKPSLPYTSLTYTSLLARCHLCISLRTVAITATWMVTGRDRVRVG